MEAAEYVTDAPVATSVHLASTLHKPLLVEGHAGVGTIKAAHPPHVILTSNRTRELSDALRRRCLYLWIDYPDFDKEVRIVERKTPGINARLAREVARFMEALRRVRLAKVPGVAET